MNFFEHQESARKKTGRLVFLFVLAVIAIITMIFFVAMAILGSQGGSQAGPETGSHALPILIGVTAFVLLVVGGGSMYKISQLSGGGTVVAEQLGGTPISAATRNEGERRLLNVVEEMSIASGIPVPPVYVMDEDAINAFAAGHTIDDAVIGVTRGTIENLTRDELQGVIAHEFSHIFNGDMRLNIRLMGTLHGILLIGLIGAFLLRGSFYGRVLGGRRRSGGGGDSQGAMIALAAALAVIGYVGTFFGNLIKAAVSRQREFLADASAVQFTRNPDGIAGALKKIGGLQYGSLLENPRAAEVSHMLFGQGYKTFLGGINATHPPLEARIKRIDPSFDGNFPAVTPMRPGPTPPRATRKPAPRIPAQRAAGFVTALATIGEPTIEQTDYARELSHSVPDSLRDALDSPFGARAVVFALLLDADSGVRTRQLEHLERGADRATYDMTLAIHGLTRDLDERVRLVVIDLAIPVLRQMSRGQYTDFEQSIGALIREDAKIDLFEWVLTRVVLRHVGAQFSRSKHRGQVQYYALGKLGAEISTLLTTLAFVGHSSEDEAHAAIIAGAERIGVPGVGPAREGSYGLGALEKALDVLDTVKPTLKQSLLEACAVVIGHDHEVTVKESELFRAIADSLQCPVPPILAGQPLA